MVKIGKSDQAARYGDIGQNRKLCRRRRSSQNHQIWSKCTIWTQNGKLAKPRFPKKPKHKEKPAIFNLAKRPKSQKCENARNLPNLIKLPHRAEVAKVEKPAKDAAATKTTKLGSNCKLDRRWTIGKNEVPQAAKTQGKSRPFSIWPNSQNPGNVENGANC